MPFVVPLHLVFDAEDKKSAFEKCARAMALVSALSLGSLVDWDYNGDAIEGEVSAHQLQERPKGYISDLVLDSMRKPH